MTLEDFFTLSELKDGLATPERVNELLTIMENEKGKIVNNFNETFRQWSTVAKTIAVTENKTCLDLFINLDGLKFINTWLNDAQKLENENKNENEKEISNGFLEESIISLLYAVERLQKDSTSNAKKSSYSEIMRNLENLVAHSNSRVCEIAKSLRDSLINDSASEDVENLDNDEKKVEKSDNIQQVIENNEIIKSDSIMETESANLEPVDQSAKSTVDDKVADLNSDVKDENEINCIEKAELVVETSTLSMSAAVDNVLEASRKTDPISDKSDDVADDSASQDSKTSSSSESDREVADVAKEENENSKNGKSFFKLSINASKASDMELDYGMIDPLEVARQVANEVEREVDSRERSCSTSTNSQENCKNPTPLNGSDKEVSSEPKSQTEPLKVKEAEIITSEPFRRKPDITISQVSELAQESEPRGFSGFDLNQEVCSEEVNNITNPISSSTISIVSASRPSKSANLPITPLQFEGTLGWKGSASTSAFRQINNNSNNNSKQRLDCLNIDLNVTEGSEDKIEEESSVDASPVRLNRPQLDLNTMGGENADVAGFDWRRDLRVASISSSSSSSSKQPSGRNINIDLNLNDPYVNKLSKQNESVISIFGTKVEVKNKDSRFLPEASGRILEASTPTIDFNITKNGPGLGLSSGLGSGLSSSVHYNTPHYYGPNGYPTGPAMFFAPPVYGSPGVHIPYMVDSRGSPVIPQIMGGSSSTYGQQSTFGQHPPPFIMNMGHLAGPGTSSGSSGPIGPGPNSFDLNHEINGGLRQLFPHSNGSNGGKRREPDTRFDFFPVNKQQQPPWR